MSRVLEPQTFEYLLFGIVTLIMVICLVGFAINSSRLKRQNRFLSAAVRDLYEIRRNSERESNGSPLLVKGENFNQPIQTTNPMPGPANIHIENNFNGIDRAFEHKQESSEGLASIENNECERKAENTKEFESPVKAGQENRGLGLNSGQAGQDALAKDSRSESASHRDTMGEGPFLQEELVGTGSEMSPVLESEKKSVDALDVIAMIHNNANANQYTARPIVQDGYNVGKSGRHYTEGEIEQIITD